MKNQLKFMLVAGGLMLVLSSLTTVSAYPPFLRQAQKFGAQDCTFCHTKAEGGEGWNERGKWLMGERDKRKADSIDIGWLAEYKEGGAAAGAATSAAAMSADEKAKAIGLLKKSMEETLKAVEQLSDAQWNFKAAPDKWSAGQTAEHILKSEALLLGVVQRVSQAPVNPEWEAQTKGKTEMMEVGVLNREQKFQAPEPLKPGDTMKRDEFIAQFKEARAKTIKFVEDNNTPIKEHTADHPALKTLNGYQWLLLLPLHNMRHNLQIEEVKANAGFPKK